MPKIKNAKILILATDGFEQSELDVPREKLKAVAQLVHVAAPRERKEKETHIVDRLLHPKEQENDIYRR